MLVNCPISVGEYLDKYSILLVKLQKINDPEKLADVKKELEMIKNVILIDSDLQLFLDELYHCNLRSWENNEVRRSAIFVDDNVFLESCKKEMELNNQRYVIKKKINILCNSEIVERKGHL